MYRHHQSLYSTKNTLLHRHHQDHHRTTRAVVHQCRQAHLAHLIRSFLLHRRCRTHRLSLQLLSLWTRKSYTSTHGHSLTDDLAWRVLTGNSDWGPHPCAQESEDLAWHMPCRRSRTVKSSQTTDSARLHERSSSDVAILCFLVQCLCCHCVARRPWRQGCCTTLETLGLAGACSIAFYLLVWSYPGCSYDHIPGAGDLMIHWGLLSISLSIRPVSNH